MLIFSSGLTGCEGNACNALYKDIKTVGYSNQPSLALEQNYLPVNHEWFIPIIYTYAIFEKTNFTIYDDSIMGGFFMRHSDDSLEYNGTRLDSRLYSSTLVYALYDINHDGIYELITGFSYAFYDDKPTR